MQRGKDDLECGFCREIWDVRQPGCRGRYRRCSPPRGRLPSSNRISIRVAWPADMPRPLRCRALSAARWCRGAVIGARRYTCRGAAGQAPTLRALRWRRRCNRRWRSGGVGKQIVGGGFGHGAAIGLRAPWLTSGGRAPVLLSDQSLVGAGSTAITSPLRTSRTFERAFSAIALCGQTGTARPPREPAAVIKLVFWGNGAPAFQSRAPPPPPPPPTPQGQQQPHHNRVSPRDTACYRSAPSVAIGKAPVALVGDRGEGRALHRRRRGRARIRRSTTRCRECARAGSPSRCNSSAASSPQSRAIGDQHGIVSARRAQTLGCG